MDPQLLEDPEDAPVLPDAMRRQQALWLERSERAQALAAQVYDRLLTVAAGDTGQAGRVAQFLAATFNGAAYRFDLAELRMLDIAISDDVLLCLDALRWGKADLHRLVPNGDVRVQAVISAWGLKPEGWL